jgi:hypothetical protein
MAEIGAGQYVDASVSSLDRTGKAWQGVWLTSET